MTTELADVRRVAVYLLPDGAFGAAGAAWLGWDAAAGRAVMHPDLPDLPAPLADLTAVPRRYGFHATIKPPMRLAPGATPDDLCAELSRVARGLAPVDVPLGVGRIGRFLAIVPQDGGDGLRRIAAAVVDGLDPLRAPLTDADIARRNPATLTARQVELLHRYGYPYVMEEFHAHLTLTDRLDADTADAVQAVAQRHFAPHLQAALRVDTLAMVGEGADGRFRLLARAPLGAA